MKIDSKKLICPLTPVLPYILIGLVATNLGEIVPYGFSVHFPFRKDHGTTERVK